jgi:hypothetical protein
MQETPEPCPAPALGAGGAAGSTIPQTSRCAMPLEGSRLCRPATLRTVAACDGTGTAAARIRVVRIPLRGFSGSGVPVPRAARDDLAARRRRPRRGRRGGRPGCPRRAFPWALRARRRRAQAAASRPAMTPAWSGAPGWPPAAGRLGRTGQAPAAGAGRRSPWRVRSRPCRDCGATQHTLPGGTGTAGGWSAAPGPAPGLSGRPAAAGGTRRGHGSARARPRTERPATATGRTPARGSPGQRTS